MTSTDIITFILKDENVIYCAGYHFSYFSPMRGFHKTFAGVSLAIFVSVSSKGQGSWESKCFVGHCAPNSPIMVMLAGNK